MKIIIVGAGIAGLRAGLELAPAHEVTILEKSSGVGGRIASRRMGSVVVNHGAQEFQRGAWILNGDPLAKKFETLLPLKAAATDLPKALRDEFLRLGGVLRLKTRIKKLEGKTVTFEDGQSLSFDAAVLTSPVPQTREILAQAILPGIDYSKDIFLIGEKNSRPVIQKLPPQMAEELFELPDEDLRRSLPSEDRELDLKRWRYSRVKLGHPQAFYVHREDVVLAGDAFDPEGIYDIASAWVSGREAGRYFK